MTRTLAAGLAALTLAAVLAAAIPAQAAPAVDIENPCERMVGNQITGPVITQCRQRFDPTVQYVSQTANAVVQEAMDAVPDPPACLDEGSIVPLAAACVAFLIGLVHVPNPQAWSDYEAAYSAQLTAWEADSQGKALTWANNYAAALEVYRAQAAAYEEAVGTDYSAQVGAYVNAARDSANAYAGERQAAYSAYANGALLHAVCVVFGPQPCPPTPAVPAVVAPPVDSNVPLPPDAPEPPSPLPPPNILPPPLPPPPPTGGSE